MSGRSELSDAVTTSFSGKGAHQYRRRRAGKGNQVCTVHTGGGVVCEISRLWAYDLRSSGRDKSVDSSLAAERPAARLFQMLRADQDKRGRTLAARDEA